MTNNWLEFKQFDDNRVPTKVTIDPNAVVALAESEERQGFGGYSSITTIHLNTGTTYKVWGHVAEKIRKAQGSGEVRKDG
jgi:hypothetical protein